MKKRTAMLLLLSLLLTLLLPFSLQAEEAPAEKKEAEPIDSALSQPSYPEMPPYPNEQDYIDPKNGNFDDEGFRPVYDAWEASKKAQAEYRENFLGDFAEYYARTSREILLNTDEKNPVYSPLSLYLALSMLCEVSEGKSREEVLAVLGTKDPETARADALALWKSNYSDDGAVSSKLANSFWLNKDLAYRKETLKKLAEYYFASAFQGEMGSEAYDQDLRRWINQQTGDLLKDQSGELKFTKEMVFSLVSTLFFQAKWQDEFNKDFNEKKIFHGSDHEAERSFMQSERPQSYYWAENFGAVQKSLHYGGTVWLVLPDKNSSVEEVLKNPKFYELTRTAYADESWKDSKFLTVKLALPNFDVAANLQLEKNLKALGIREAFDQEKADFSPLFQDPRQRAFLSEARQGSRVAIDERGVTAAAFTAMMLYGAAAPPEERMDFVLDRPFIFVICGISGDPLFIGAVNQLE